MRTLIAGGGTGGHLTPALAVAQALREHHPDAEVLLVSRRGGVAEELVEAAGIPLATIPISGLDFSDLASIPRFGVRVPAAVVRSLRLIREFGADVVVGTAGYVSAPVVLAARTLRIPIVLLEQNAVPGRTTRLLARSAAVVATSFAQTGASLNARRVVFTGNPIRREVAQLQVREQGDRCRHVLVMGGSQGARRLNEAVMAGLRDLLEDPEIRVTHQTGELDRERVERFRSMLDAGLRDRYAIADFFTDIAEQEADADLVVMRAGGSSLAEVSALGKPMVLIPYAHAGAHQELNAAAYVSAGAAVRVADEEFSGTRFVSEVRRMTADPARWRAMAAASAQMGKRDAADRVVALIDDVVKHRMRRTA